MAGAKRERQPCRQPGEAAEQAAASFLLVTARASKGRICSATATCTRPRGWAIFSYLTSAVGWGPGQGGVGNSFCGLWKEAARYFFYAKQGTAEEVREVMLKVVRKTQGKGGNTIKGRGRIRSKKE